MTILAVGMLSGSCLAAQTTNEFVQDFDVAIRRIASIYPYFDEKATRWQDVPALYAADLREVRNRDQFVVLLERVVDELYDHHAQLTVNLESSPRLVPSGTDLWAEWRDGRAVITQVRRGSSAVLVNRWTGSMGEGLAIGVPSAWRKRRVL